MQRQRARVRPSWLGALIAALLCFGGIWAPSAWAASTVGSFEIDGNLVDPTAGEPIDWSTPPPNLTNFTDATGRNDDSFNMGSKETEPGGWSCGTGSAPQKDDLLAGQVAFRTVGTDQFVYVDYTRRGVNGDAHIDYEFSKSTLANAMCPALPQRSNGDVVITFDTENGGAQIFVQACTWNGTATLGTFNCAALGPQGGKWDGAVNIPNTIPGHTAGDFGEAALNLTQTIGPIACGQFSRAYMKTRSSTSIDSALQDRTSTRPINVGDCPNSSLAKAVRNVTTNGSFGTTATASPGNTLEYRLTYTNAGPGVAHDVVLTDQIQAKQTFLSCSASCVNNNGTLTWSLGTVAANTSVVVTFRVQLDAVFPAGTTAVKNTAVVVTREEPQKPSNETTTTVTAAPNSVLVKAVRNVTTGGSFASTATASPGDTLEYRLTYTNTGNAPASGVVISDTIQARQTFLSCSDSCTHNGSVSWSLGTVQPGVTPIVRTFQVRLDATFPAGTTTVRNVGTVRSDQETTPKPSNETTVTVTAAPDLALKKEADKSEVVPGDTITYTLTASNTGNANASNVTIKEDIPPGTSFVSCSDNCAHNGTATWSIGTLSPDESRSVTLTVQVLDAVGCQICNVATISSPDQGGGAAIDSNRVCIDATPGPNPAGANASDSAFGAHVEAKLLNINTTLTPVSSSQSGVGSDSESDDLLNVNVPDANAGVLHAGVLETTSKSTVDDAPAEADHLSMATATDVRVLKGATGTYAVEADLVRAVAHANATGSSSAFDSVGSNIVGLKVAGVARGSVAPNTTIDLPDLVFGPNSFVVVYQRNGSTSGPAAGQLSGGTYAADVEVNMIRVHTDDLPQTPQPDPVDVTVSNAKANADFPQTRLCEAAPVRAVSGDAFIARETTDPLLLPLEVGFVSIPSSGGSDEQHLLSAKLPEPSGSVVTTGVANSSSTGTLNPTSTTATSEADAADVCLLKDAAGVCTVSATAVKSQAKSDANAAGASSTDAGTSLVNVRVGSTTIPATPARNTVIQLPGGIGFVILNEQRCDNNQGTLPTCAGPTSSGLTVTAIHVVVTKGALGALPGAEIKVAEAHSDATFAP